MKTKSRRPEGKCDLRQVSFHPRGISHLSVRVRIYYCNYSRLSYVKMTEEVHREEEMCQDFKPRFKHLLPRLLQEVLKHI